MNEIKRKVYCQIEVGEKLLHNTARNIEVPCAKKKSERSEKKWEKRENKIQSEESLEFWFLGGFLKVNTASLGLNTRLTDSPTSSSSSSSSDRDISKKKTECETAVPDVQRAQHIRAIAAEDIPDRQNSTWRNCFE